MSIDIAIIAALEREVRPLVRKWSRRPLGSGNVTFPAFVKDGTFVVCCGIGGSLARQAAVALFAAYSPRVIVSAGLAGGLDSSLQVAQIFHPSFVVDLTTGVRYEAGGGDGVLVSASSVLDREAKQRIGGAFGARAADMEAASVALVAEQHGCPFIAIKSISDEAGFSMPSFERFIDARGQIRRARFLASCARRPSTWPMLICLARNTARASQELCRALAHLIQQHRTPQPAFSGNLS